MVVLHVLLALLGGAVVLATVGSAIRTVVLPRAVPARLTTAVFAVLRTSYEVRMRRSRSYEDRDAALASFAPLGLLVLLGVWLSVCWLGTACVYIGLGLSFVAGLRESGSSLLTLGFDRPASSATALVSFVEAAVGLVLLALLITYLPSLYGAFSRREAAVTKLQVRAGSPPSGTELLERVTQLRRLELLPALFATWEDVFIELEETHTSFPALTYFRSPQPDHSWVTASGALLDAAALLVSSVALDPPVEAQLTIRAGTLALRRICAFHGLAYPPDPRPEDAISVTRQEYDEALARLERAGLTLRPDRDRAWRDFAGWRVNYDAVLLALATLVMAPYAPWSSDRSAAFRRSPVLSRRRTGPGA